MTNKPIWTPIKIRLGDMEMDAINKLMKMYPNSIRKVTRGGSKYSIHLDF